MLLRNHLRRTKRKRRDSSSSSSSSSSSDSSATDKSPSKKRSRSRKRALAGPGFNLGQNNRNMSKVGKNKLKLLCFPEKRLKAIFAFTLIQKEMMMLMEVQPIAVDPNISFESVGGLNQFIGKLKEIVLFPLMYGEFYNMRGMRPPRGILLHGPPGKNYKMCK
jgi:SpoVK/Ycf46/Vps4 family AAA+-type ATPase